MTGDALRSPSETFWFFDLFFMASKLIIYNFIESFPAKTSCHVLLWCWFFSDYHTKKVRHRTSESILTSAAVHEPLLRSTWEMFFGFGKAWCIFTPAIQWWYIGTSRAPTCRLDSARSVRFLWRGPSDRGSRTPECSVPGGCFWWQFAGEFFQFLFGVGFCYVDLGIILWSVFEGPRSNPKRFLWSSMHVSEIDLYKSLGFLLTSSEGFRFSLSHRVVQRCF